MKYKYDMLLSQFLFGENIRYKPKSANNLGKNEGKSFAYLNWTHTVTWEVDMISALHENQSYLGQQTFLFLSECNSGWSHRQQILHS